MSTQNELKGGTIGAPNRAPAAKVLAGALANHRVASALITALGKWANQGMIIATSTSQTVDFASLVVGDIVMHIPATAGNSNFRTVATAGTLGQAAVVGDLYMVMRAQNLDANNPKVPTGGQLEGRDTSPAGSGEEF